LIEFVEDSEIEMAAIFVEYSSINGERKDRAVSNFSFDFSFG